MEAEQRCLGGAELARRLARRLAEDGLAYEDYQRQLNDIAVLLDTGRSSAKRVASAWHVECYFVGVNKCFRSLRKVAAVFGIPVKATLHTRLPPPLPEGLRALERLRRKRKPLTSDIMDAPVPSALNTEPYTIRHGGWRGAVDHGNLNLDKNGWHCSERNGCGNDGDNVSEGGHVRGSSGGGDGSGFAVCDTVSGIDRSPEAESMFLSVGGKLELKLDGGHGPAKRLRLCTPGMPGDSTPLPDCSPEPVCLAGSAVQPQCSSVGASSTPADASALACMDGVGGASFGSGDGCCCCCGGGSGGNNSAAELPTAPNNRSPHANRTDGFVAVKISSRPATSDASAADGIPPSVLPAGANGLGGAPFKTDGTSTGARLLPRQKKPQGSPGKRTRSCKQRASKELAEALTALAGTEVICGDLTAQVVQASVNPGGKRMLLWFEILDEYGKSTGELVSGNQLEMRSNKAQRRNAWTSIKVGHLTLDAWCNDIAAQLSTAVGQPLALHPPLMRSALQQLREGMEAAASDSSDQAAGPSADPDLRQVQAVTEPVTTHAALKPDTGLSNATAPATTSMPDIPGNPGMPSCSDLNAPASKVGRQKLPPAAWVPGTTRRCTPRNRNLAVVALEDPLLVEAVNKRAGTLVVCGDVKAHLLGLAAGNLLFQRLDYQTGEALGEVLSRSQLAAHSCLSHQNNAWKTIKVEGMSLDAWVCKLWDEVARDTSESEKHEAE